MPVLQLAKDAEDADAALDLWKGPSIILLFLIPLITSQSILEMHFIAAGRPTSPEHRLEARLQGTPSIQPSSPL